jgi:lipopolysaccharide/colanic/teichoic acid biosynthesis glycosyltransferase
VFITIFEKLRGTKKMIFKQTRIGKNGDPFVVYKFRSIPKGATLPNTWGKFLRKTKFDELPQIINIWKGEMAIIGPRPDISGYADALQGEDRIILSVKPGITGLASLKYRKEEAFLDNLENPNEYNDNIIWPDKVLINKWYIQNRNLKMDIQIIFFTLFPFPFNVDLFIEKNKTRNTK